MNVIPAIIVPVVSSDDECMYVSSGTEIEEKERDLKVANVTRLFL
jgi:hypothetical protein